MNPAEQLAAAHAAIARLEAESAALRRAVALAWAMLQAYAPATVDSYDLDLTPDQLAACLAQMETTA